MSRYDLTPIGVAYVAWKERQMAAPTLGNMVLFYPSDDDVYYARVRGEKGKPLAAFVAYIHEDGRLNLMVVDQLGDPVPIKQVRFLVPGEPRPEGKRASWCEARP